MAICRRNTGGTEDESGASGTARHRHGVPSREIGYQEGRSDGGRNNQQKFSTAVPGREWSPGQSWCHTFVSWAFRQADLADLAPVTASCAEGVQ
ncbi:hypothetical protein [Streptomyces yunnanensis]|uniref:hypothetical protein n=1 Tax=Streptomyces yunnanensis TaxID=156453 RepID=UPI0011610677|nr:hypothetical protein [Streptomyces yunnanensis]